MNELPEMPLIDTMKCRRSPENLVSRSIYWHLTLFLKSKYVLYWLLVATVVLSLSEIVLRVFGEPHFMWTEIFFAYFIISAIPVGNLIAANIFIELTDTLSPMFKLEEGSFSSWITQEGRKVFDVRYFPMWATSLSINVLGTLTLVVAGLPFKSEIANIFALIAIQPIFFFCGQAAYFLVAMMIFQYRVAKLPLSIPFFEYCHRAIYELSSYSYSLALFVLIQYVGLFFAIHFGPYGNSVFMIPWLISLAVTPIISFSWGVYQIHILQREIKLKHIESITSEVQKLFEEFISNPTLNNIDRLSKTIEIQRNVEQIKEWPLSLQTIITLILATVAAISQILIAISSLLKPIGL